MLSQTPKTKALLEIIPDTNFVVFQGDEHNAVPATLRGVVRLDSPESISIKAVKLRLEGKRRVGWFYAGGISAGEVSEKKTFYQEARNLGTTGTHKIKAGVIEWPFEFTLDPSLPESVEGIANTLVRTLGLDQMETTRSRMNADIWANKISYSISIPSDAVVFGTSILADVELAPLRKGITLGTVDMRLSENIIRRISAFDTTDHRTDKVKIEEIEVVKHEMPFPQNSRVEFDGETVDNPVMEDERYHFKARLPLPKSLKLCRQDVDSHPINITHKFKLMVNIHNPEGHVSQLVCRLPVKLFISPNLPIDELNEIRIATSPTSEERLNSQENTVVAPPVYGQHQLDELYSDLGPSGLNTSAPSGVTTPSALSRRASNEHSYSGTTPDSSSGLINTALLRSRLVSLQDSARPTSNHGTPHSRTQNSSGHISPRLAQPQAIRNISTSHSPHTSAEPSRRGSAESPPELSQADYDLLDLRRIPSYGTALRTSGHNTPFTAHPPSYMEATSRPPSPGPFSSSPGTSTSPRLAAGMPHRPAQARINHETESEAQAQTRARSASTRSDASTLTVMPGLARVDTGSRVDEGDARLRMLRARV